jgi:hypothetical protein
MSIKHATKSETDVTKGAMAFQAARYGRKLLAADHDVKRYRNRMNAVTDKQAGIPPTPANAYADNTDVFTDSPVTSTTTTTTNMQNGGWLLALVTALALIAGFGLAGTLTRNATPTPTPSPPVTPTPTGWQITVK